MSAYESAVRSLGPLRYFPMTDEAGGAQFDRVLATTDTVGGTVGRGGQGGPIQGATQRSFSFGSGDISVAHLDRDNPPLLSLAWWARPNAANTSRSMLAKATGSSLTAGYGHYRTSGGLEWLFVDSFATAGNQAEITPITTGEWWFLTLTFSPGAVLGYRQGRLNAVDTRASAYTASTYPLIMGRYADVTDRWDGWMAHVALFPRVLSPSEIELLYLMGRGLASTSRRRM